MEDRAGPHAAHAHRHAVAAIGIETRLGTIGLGHHLDGRLWRARQVQFLRPALEGAHGLDHVGNRRRLRELDRHGDGVAIDDRHAVGVGADAHRVRLAAAVAAENLLRLGLHLLFFAADVGHDVAEDVERGHAGIAGAGHRLHRLHDDARDAEGPQRRERRGEYDRRAVWIGDDGAGPALHATLLGNEAEVVGVHFGDEQRHERVHAEVARVADDDVAGGSEGAFHLARHRRVETREHNLWGPAGSARVHRAAGGLGRHRRGQTPRRGVAVGLALRSLARRQPHRLEPWVTRETHDEMLTDDAGGAEHTYFD